MTWLTLYLATAAGFALAAWWQDHKDGTRILSPAGRCLFGLLWPVVLAAAIVQLFMNEED